MWPFPDELVARAAEKARRIVVPEMNLGQLALEVERAVGSRDNGASAGRAKVSRLGKVNGELFRPEEVYASIVEAG
jgi:2-oxoglutarate ferredoxin oxidoreductase subunit alpha